MKWDVVCKGNSSKRKSPKETLKGCCGKVWGNAGVGDGDGDVLLSAAVYFQRLDLLEYE